MTMSNIARYAQHSLLALAACGENVGGQTELTWLVRGVGLTPTQSKRLADSGWRVAHHLGDAGATGGGYAATLFHHAATGEYVLANRGAAELPDLYADSWSRGTQKIAGARIIGMYRYYKQLITPAGQAVKYWQDEFDRLHAIGCAYAPDEFGMFSAMQQRLESDVGLGVLPLERALTVVGHDLGGHLAVWLNALIPTGVAHVYAFNGAGLGAVLRDVAIRIAGLFGGIDGILDGVSVTNVYAHSITGGLSLIDQIGRHVPVLVQEKSAQDGPESGMTRLTDALAVADVLFKFDPSLTLNTTNALFRAAGGAYPDMLGAVVDDLSELLLAAPRGVTSANREALYGALDVVQRRAASCELLGKLRVGLASGLLSVEAHADFSALLALDALSIVALRGNSETSQQALNTMLGEAHRGLYALWQADHALSGAERAAGKAHISFQWLADRSAMLGLLAQGNGDEVKKRRVQLGVQTGSMPALAADSTQTQEQLAL